LRQFIDAYCAWRRLPPTKEGDQRWYRLRLTFDTGLFGSQKCDMDIDFLDGSGEVYETESLTPAQRKMLESAFRDATIMVFCLPLWVAFPNSETMTDDDWDKRNLRL